MAAHCTFALADGQWGDDTGVDGFIIDAGGPGQPQQPVTSVPATTGQGLLILILLLGTAAVSALRKLS